MEQRIVAGQRAVGPDPEPLDGFLAGVVAERQLARCGAGRWDGAGRTSRRGPPGTARAWWPGSRGTRGREPRAWGTGGSCPARPAWNEADRLKMARPCWIGHHPAGGERPAVTDAVHLVEDGHRRVPGTQEVGSAASGAWPMSTVRPAAISDWAATWPPNTRCRSSLGLTPRKMLTSIDSRSSRSTRKSRASLTAPSCQLADGRRSRRRPAPAELRRSPGSGPRLPGSPPPRRGPGTVPDATLRYRIVATSASPTASSGARPPRPTRSRAGTSTTTGGRWSTTPPRAASSRAGTPATPSTAIPRTSPWWPTWVWPPTGSRSSGAASSPPRGSSPGWRSTTTGACAAACHEHGISPVVTFHHFTTPAGWRPPAPGRPSHAPDRFARFCERVDGAPRGPHRPGLHPQRAQRRGHHGVASRDLPARGSGTGSVGDARQRGPGDRPSQGRRGHPVGTRATSPVGLTLSMADFQASRAGRSGWSGSERPSEDVFLEATGGDDFIGVQTYTRDARSGPTGSLPAEDGRPDHPDGLRVLARGPRGTPSGGPGR